MEESSVDSEAGGGAGSDTEEGSEELAESVAAAGGGFAISSVISGFLSAAAAAGGGGSCCTGTGLAPSSAAGLLLLREGMMGAESFTAGAAASTMSTGGFTLFSLGFFSAFASATVTPALVLPLLVGLLWSLATTGAAAFSGTAAAAFSSF